MFDLTQTGKLYETNAYLTRCEAQILQARILDPEEKASQKCDEQDSDRNGCVQLELVLDRTVFFPEGGGQSADRGWIQAAGSGEDFSREAMEVTDVQITDGVIRHYAACPKECAPCFKAGDRVILQIDWERRFEFMQNHTGEHILSGLMRR